MTHMLMGLAQGKLVVCLEVGPSSMSISTGFWQLLIYLPGWLQPHINLQIGFSRNANSYR